VAKTAAKQRAKRTPAKKAPAKKASARARKKTEDVPLQDLAGGPSERVLELIDEAVAERGRHVLAELDLTNRIAELASEARRQNVPVHVLTQHVKRMDPRQRRLFPVSRQSVDNMVAVFEGRREARTTVASRRRRPKPADNGRLNADALR
jgi:hypothetical protein